MIIVTKKIIKILIPKSIINIINNFLNRINVLLTWDPWINFSYSQEGEDMVLKRIFSHQTSGFYVDIGAHHPKRFSNTYIFYKKGWRGINIDAKPGSMELFNKWRPKDINLELGIAEKKGVLEYYVFNEPALNSFSKELSLERDKEKSDYYIKEVINISVKPLSDILNTHLKNQQIDYLSIDVEGMDLEVLKSNNWSKYRPKFILVEILESSLSDVDKDPIVEYLKKLNYFIYAKQVNTVFLGMLMYSS